VQAGEAHAGRPESFGELFARVAGEFGNGTVRGRGHAQLLGLLSQGGGRMGGRSEALNTPSPSWIRAALTGDPGLRSARR